MGKKYYRAEELLEVACPKCGAAAGKFCDRRKDRLSKQGKVLAASGTPPSHTERMWFRQGHTEEEFPALRAGLKPGNYPARGTSREWDTGFDRDPPKSGSARASGYGL